MSYDVSLYNDEGAEVSWHNMTSNVSRMWRHAGANVAEFHGHRAGEVLDQLVGAVVKMLDEPDVYRAMNPSNGWGSYESCLKFLYHLTVDFGAHPNATVHVSH